MDDSTPTSARAIMRRQRGLITRPQVLERTGLTDLDLAHLLRSGAWVNVRRGVYATGEFLAAQQTLPQRQRVYDDAACLRVTTDHVRSHDSAALVLGIPILLPPRRFTHLTRPTVHGTRHEYGVKHHVAPYRADQVVEVDGIRCLDPARTAVDIARELGHPYGLVAFDSVTRPEVGVTSAEIDAVFSQMRNWPHRRRALAQWERSDPHTDSIGETLLRDLVEELGFGRPLTQIGLTDGTREAWVDLLLGRHVFEFDGRIKYQPPARGGLALRPAEEVVWDEKTRQDFVCGFKLGMSRVVWEDMYGRSRDRALARAAREYLDTCRRFGTSIDDLRPYLLPRSRRPRAA